MDQSGKSFENKTASEENYNSFINIFLFCGGGGRFDPIFLNILFFPRLKKDLKDVYSVKEELFWTSEKEYYNIILKFKSFFSTP